MSPWLGLDLGQKKIGLAISDSAHRLAFPLVTIATHPTVKTWRYLQRLIAERQVTRLVIGQPHTLDGQALSPPWWHHWQQRLATLSLPLSFINERMSSAEAAERLAYSPTDSDQADDAVAAQIILQRYLDQHVQNTH